jgi:ABC-2 type transport system ATP-binding protein
MTSDYALEVTGLCKRYKGFALKGVTFQLPRGYIGGLIGPNGAGKTTIIKIIMNLVRPSAGAVKVFGLDHRADEVEVKSRIGFVYDVPGFWGDMSLNAHRRALAPFYPRWNHATFDRLASELALPLNKHFKALSHGMQTKFALVMALSHDADLLVMDEPTAGLDPLFRRELLQRLSALLQDDGKSVLFSTHITSDLARMADFITLIRNGEVAFSLPKDDLLDRWAVAKGDAAMLGRIDPTILRGSRRRAFGVEALVSDVDALRRSLGSEVVVDKATLDDVMVLMTGENAHAA